MKARACGAGCGATDAHVCPNLAVVMYGDHPQGIVLANDDTKPEPVAEPSDLTLKEQRRLEFYVGYLGRMDGDRAPADKWDDLEVSNVR